MLGAWASQRGPSIWGEEQIDFWRSKRGQIKLPNSETAKRESKFRDLLFLIDLFVLNIEGFVTKDDRRFCSSNFDFQRGPRAFFDEWQLSAQENRRRFWFSISLDVSQDASASLGRELDTKGMPARFCVHRKHN